MTYAWLIEENRCQQIASPAAVANENDVIVAVEASQLSSSAWTGHALQRPLVRSIVGPGATQVVPGIAAVGIVVGAGEQALSLLGKRVLIGRIDPCGECIVCRRGRASLCAAAKHRGVTIRGTLAQRVTVQARWVVVLDDELSIAGAHAAAIAGDVAAAYTLYACSNLASSDAVIVCGQTAVTRFVVEILRAKGISPTVIADATATGWCDWLASKGAIIVDSATSIVDLVTAASDAMKAALPDAIAHRAWRVIATDTSSLGQALAVTASPGAQILLWAPAEQATALHQEVNSLPSAIAKLLRHEASLTAITAPHPDLLVDVAAMVAKGEIQLATGVEFVSVASLRSAIATDPTCSLVVTIP